MNGVRARERSDLIKLAIFLAVSAVLTGYLVIITSEARPGDYQRYRASFENVSGLEVGDKVRIAGVVVGKVAEVSVRPDASVQVDFDVEKDLPLNTATRATVQYRNLIGDRVLLLSRPDDNAPRLAPGAMIPVSNTASALDLDTLLNGFKPLFAGLSPSQINQLSAQLIGVLQGQDSAIRTLVTTVGSFTNSIADREGLVSEVIGNLQSVLQTVEENKAGLGSLIDELSELTAGLDRQDTQILDAAASIDGFSKRASTLIRQARADLTPGLQGLTSSARGLNKSSDTLEAVLAKLPTHYTKILQSASYGNFFNFFLCGVRVQLTGGENPVRTPWVISDLARCRR